MNSVVISIVVNGALVTGSVPATLRGDVVVAPLDPYVRALATRISLVPQHDSILVGRGGRLLTLALGSRVVRGGPEPAQLPIAPYLLAGNLIIPLAATARALGAKVAYDARTHTLAILVPDLPLETLAPVVRETPAPSGLPTFVPTPTPAPQPTISGIPKPRRTPIPVGPDG